MPDQPVAPAARHPDAREVAAYAKAIRQSFAFLKRTHQLADLFVKSIPLSAPEGCLAPVCDLHADDEVLIGKLADWRQRNSFAFPTQFPVTHAGTATWLRSRLLEVEDRILFLVVDRHGTIVGHLGFANCLNSECEMELDNVLRGVSDTAPGVMREAIRALLAWAHQVIGPRQFFLRVLDDNPHAIGFYRELGFWDAGRAPLRKHVQGETVSFAPVEAGDLAPPDKHFLRMIFRPPVEEADGGMILTAGPSISAREAFYAWDAARTGWNRNWSGYLSRFESSFAEYVGTQHAIATSSGTGALQIALMALGIGPGDEVIVPDLTWVATANAVRYVGATPVFADVEFETWNLDAESVAAKITPKTRAVMPVHMYGHPARMDRIMAVARQHHLFVVEDAAPAIGAEWQGQRCGTFGDFAAFSFQGAKLVVTGEGGMLVTSNTELHRKALKIWDQGRNPDKTFWIDAHGVKFKMSNVQAAIGLGQLERCDELIAMKRRIFDWYAEGLQGVPHLRLNREPEGARSIYWMSSLFLHESCGMAREPLRAEMKRRGVDTRPVFPAISQYPIWDRPQTPQPVARRVGERAMNLPSGVCLRRTQVDHVCRVIREILAQRS